MTRINTNVASLRGLRSLNRSSDLLGTSLQRLSTGLKINTGKDAPAGLIASETLRSQITAIEQSITNSNRANNVIATADSALGEIGGLLNQVRGLVQEGLNSGALSQEEIEANQLQIDAALSAINRISANTSFAGDKLIDGSKAFVTSVTTADAAKLSDYNVNEALFGSSSTIEIDATVNTVAERGELRYAGGALTAAANLEIAGSRGQQVLFLGASSSVSNIRDSVNAVSDVTGVEASIRNGLRVSEAANANTVTINPAGNNNNLVFTDARATATEGADATLGGSISIVYANPGAASQALSVATATDGNGNHTITINLATDANSAITTTAAQLDAAIAGNATANALVSVTNAAGNDGTGVVTAIAATALTGGTDSGAITFTDARTDYSTGTVDIVFDGTGASQALGVAVTSSGDDRTVTVTLATDANGNVTSTLDDVAALIEGDTAASAVVTVDVTGDGDNLASDQASADLAATNGTLVLQSANFGADEFVDVNVLSGTFATTLSDLATTASRDTGLDIGVIINGQAAQGKGLRASIRNSTLDASLVFNEANNTAAETATVTITGGGSLFQIGQEASAAGQIGVGIDAINTARLGGVTGKLYELGTGGGRSLLDVGPNVSGSELVNIIEEAINKVSTLRGRLGALQKNVIETNITSLGVALENVTEARSLIVDTDFASETASLTRAQILSQAGLSVLGIANQNPSQVLSLLG